MISYHNENISQTEQVCVSLMQQSSEFHLIIRKALMSQHDPFS